MKQTIYAPSTLAKRAGGKALPSGVVLGFVACGLMAFTSLAVAAVVALDAARPAYYGSLPFLPLCQGVLCGLFFKLFAAYLKTPTTFIVLSFTYVRNTVAVLFMYFGNYYSAFYVTQKQHINYAVALLIYETALMYLLLYRLATQKQAAGHGQKTPRRGLQLRFGGAPLLWLVMAGICGVCLFAYLTVPEIKAYYTTIFSGQELSFSVTGVTNPPAGGLARILYTFFTTTFYFLELFLPAAAIYFLVKKFGQNYGTLAVSMLVVLLLFFVISQETMLTLVFVAVLLLYILRIFTRFRRQILLAGGLALCGVLLVIYLAKIDTNVASSGNTLNDLSMLVQSYFVGVPNTAATREIVNPSKISSFLYDLYNTIPFRNTLFGALPEHDLQYYFVQSTGVDYHIMPCSGYTAHYLGFALAPVAACFFVWLSFKSWVAAARQNNIWRYIGTLFLCLFAAMAPVMYNPRIFLMRYLATILPLMVLACFSSSKYSFSSLAGASAEESPLAHAQASAL